MSGPLRVVVIGLDERALNLFRMFFRGPCQNQAVIVDHEKEGEVFLVDLDTQQGAKLLAQQRESHPERVFIALSVKDQESAEGIVSVKKPAQAQSMIAAIEKARALIKSTPAKEKKPSLFSWASRKSAAPTPPPPPATTPSRQETKPATPLPKASPSKPAGEARTSIAEGVKVVARPGKDETAVHRVAMLLDEQGFKSYLGHRDDIDPSEPAQLASAFYDPRAYLQGHIQSAVKVASSRNEAIRLETPWKFITILPEQGFIHIQADEAQVRAACGIPFRNIVGVDVDAITLQQVVNLKPVGPEELEEILNSSHLVRLDAFLWKVALFTSKGRLPKGLDIHQAVFLKRWPGMTRLVLPPHAMRIAALLVAKPQTLVGAAKRMGIRQQYMFAFVSAAFALGLIGQQAITVAAEATPETERPAAIAQPERQSLFRKILSRLKLI
ncbi:MAG: hypothetical protein ACKN9T_14570 [Candidatus Methylumidiphilus sp.]